MKRCILALSLAIGSSAAWAQVPPPGTKPVVEKIGDRVFRIGSIRVDTAKAELTVLGTVNSNVTTLEWVANTRGGMKAYESAIELKTNAIEFNAACLLIGLDPAHATHPKQHFDPNPPSGDPVEISVTWQENGKPRTISADQLLYDGEAKKELPKSRWVYTGSVMMESGHYLADLEGALIGFVHSPAPIIENVEGAGVGQYGHIVFNPNLGLLPETPITVTVRALKTTAR